MVENACFLIKLCLFQRLIQKLRKLQKFFCALLQMSVKKKKEQKRTVKTDGAVFQPDQPWQMCCH